MDRLGVAIEFAKADPTGRFVRGWASVSSVDGVAVTDWEGDQIDIEDLREAAHRFVTQQRVAKAMHAGEQVGDVIESVIIDDAFCAAIGATTTMRGWWLGMEIHDEAVRKRVRSGEFRAFSVGGRGVRKKL